MAWHAEVSDADLNWPAEHSAQAPSSAVDPVSPLVAESLLNSEPAAHVVALVMAWHAEAPDADLNWPVGHTGCRPRRPPSRPHQPAGRRVAAEPEAGGVALVMA